MEHCPACYNAGGPIKTKARAIANTDAAVLAEYGDGEWPLRWSWEKGELAANGNYLQNNEIAKRHGICGDPQQVRARSFVRLALETNERTNERQLLPIHGCVCMLDIPPPVKSLVVHVHSLMSSAFDM